MKINKDQLPTLESRRLILRAVTLADAKSIFEYAKFPVISKYVFWKPHQSLKDSEDYVKSILSEYEENHKMMWGVQVKGQSGIIGTCGFIAHYPVNKSLEIGYAYSNKHWGKGYAKEALTTIIDYAFKELDIVRIEGICVFENIGSAKTMESCHMIYEGMLHDAFTKDNEVYHCKLFAITKRMWLANQVKFKNN